MSPILARLLLRVSLMAIFVLALWTGDWIMVVVIPLFYYLLVRFDLMKRFLGDEHEIRARGHEVTFFHVWPSDESLELRAEEFLARVDRGEFASKRKRAKDAERRERQE